MLGRLGGYEVSGVVGTGGMGVVLKAHDNSLDRTVAIKVLAPHLASSGAAWKRFSREAKAAAAVLHPNVMAIHSVSHGESLPYLVMPYVRGQSLQKRIDEEGPLRLQDILRIGTQIAAGLSAAHHRRSGGNAGDPGISASPVQRSFSTSSARFEFRQQTSAGRRCALRGQRRFVWRDRHADLLVSAKGLEELSSH